MIAEDELEMMLEQCDDSRRRVRDELEQCDDSRR